MASLRRKPNSAFWYACFTMPNGQRVQRSTKTRDRKLAQKLANEFEESTRAQNTESQVRRVLSDIHKSLTGRAMTTHTVKSYVTQWLGAREGTVAKSSLDAYKAATKALVEHVGALADKDINFITVSDIAGFRDAIAAKVSGSTANKQLKIVRVLFQQAWRDGFVEQNQAAKVQTLRESQDGGVERRSFTLEELKVILEASEGEWTGMVLFGLYTGQRLGDIATLRWDMIEPNRTGISFNSRKTGRRQILPLAGPLISWLGEATKQGVFLFPKSAEIASGGRVGALSNQFRAILAKAGLVEKVSHRKKTDGQGRSAKRQLSELSFHCFRHTATSLLKSAGISSAIVQEFVGHDSKIISQNYTHIETEALRKAANALPDIRPQASSAGSPSLLPAV